MKLEREKLIRYAMLATAAVLVLLSLLLFLLMRGEGRLEAGLSLPRTSPTPVITPTATPAQVRVTAAPTPIKVQVPRAYPPAAVDLVTDGRVLYTALNVEEAVQAVEQYLAESAGLDLGHDERLIRAGFDQKLTMEAPSGKGELLNPEEALNTLRADDSLLPVTRTVVRCVIEPGELGSAVRENALLLRGSRIYRTMGVRPYTLSYYETVYRGQAAYSQVKTNEFVVGQGKMDQIIENGALTVGAASATTGPEATAVAGFDPIWPTAGTVTGPFGMTESGMRYGVEITAEKVARVMAPEGGVVVYCGQRGHLGLVIDILHDDTGCLSRLIGCQRPLVELYQRVKKGEQVAVLPEPVGETRLVTIRYELLLNGLPVNPEKYLPKK